MRHSLTFSFKSLIIPWQIYMDQSIASFSIFPFTFRSSVYLEFEVCCKGSFIICFIWKSCWLCMTGCVYGSVSELTVLVHKLFCQYYTILITSFIMSQDLIVWASIVFIHVFILEYYLDSFGPFAFPSEFYTQLASLYTHALKRTHTHTLSLFWNFD